MSTAIQQHQPVNLAAFSAEQTNLIKRTVAPDASTDELAMFLHVAAKSGLDPLQRQIWFVKRSGRVTIQAGIDGLQARAAREQDYLGMVYGVVCEKDEFQFDATTGTVKLHTYNPFGQRGKILGAWCIVQRKGLLPFSAMVRFEEFVQSASPLWRDKPAVMIEKVARSTALRRAYPEQFSGIYEAAEMPQPEIIPAESRPALRAVEPEPSAGDPAPVVDAPKKHPLPSALGLWDRLVRECEENKALAKSKLDAAVLARFGAVVPSIDWTEDDVAAIKRTLFDVPF